MKLDDLDVVMRSSAPARHAFVEHEHRQLDRHAAAQREHDDRVAALRAMIERSRRR